MNAHAAELDVRVVFFARHVAIVVVGSMELPV
jgi:hypothetical protein